MIPQFWDFYKSIGTTLFWINFLEIYDQKSCTIREINNQQILLLTSP